ncbi:mucin-5AC [Teleopsis dalmanni]|uniref:mucin-5AC n=1 Tax=Teleopsis dalmanni TaxID=139649 RepID=UPI0018CD7B19|nr:mucin-5AC [Teleopsis dalmanni]
MADIQTTILTNTTALPPITTSNPTMNTTAAIPTTASSKALKRCLSVPIIHTPTTIGTMTTRSAAAAAAAMCYRNIVNKNTETITETPKKLNHTTAESCSINSTGANHYSLGIPRSNPSSREVSPAPVFNIFAPRARRYSASYSPLCATAGITGSSTGAPLCITPRVSQLRQEECIDINSREVNHEREVHSAMQMSQSWEDLTLVAENWSCKSDEFSNPLQVVLPSGVSSCSSPSPTSNRAGLRLPYGLSPSPTRRTFATRRSMSPIAMRPSQLGPVKRKFELDDNNSNWNVYNTPPPLKKIFTESRGSSPICQSPSSVCPSPDSGTYDGRTTPKLFISKLCAINNNSTCSSPMSSSPSSALNPNDIIVNSALCSSISSSSSSSSSASTTSSVSTPTNNNIDEGISISEPDEKCTITITQPMCTDVQDETTLLEDIKNEVSSSDGCSDINIETSCDIDMSKTEVNFFNKVNTTEIGQIIYSVDEHDSKNNVSNSVVVRTTSSSNSGEPMDAINVTSTTNSDISPTGVLTSTAQAKAMGTKSIESAILSKNL